MPDRPQPQRLCYFCDAPATARFRPDPHTESMRGFFIDVCDAHVTRSRMYRLTAVERAHLAADYPEVWRRMQRFP